MALLRQAKGKGQKKEAGSLMFVPISHPGESAGWKKQVRSHAARNPVKRPQRRNTRDSWPTPPHSNSGDREECETSPWSISSSPPAQTVVRNPSPWTIVSATPQDPFDTAIRTLSSFEKNLFYIFQERDVLNRIDHIPGMKMNIPAKTAKRFWSLLTQHWLHGAIHDPGMLACVCLFACRHVQTKMGHNYPELVYQHAELYKIGLMENLTRTLKKEVEDKHVNDDTITKTMALVSDAMVLGDTDTALRQMAAAADLIDLRVSFQQSAQRHVRERDLTNLRIVFSENRGLEGALGGVSFDGEDGEDASSTPVSEPTCQRNLVFRIGREG